MSQEVKRRLLSKDDDGNEEMDIPTLWCVLQSFYDPRQCFRYRLHPGNLNMVEGVDINPADFRRIFHMYKQTFDFICEWLKNDPIDNSKNEYVQVFGPSFNKRYHSFRTAVACGVLSLVQFGTYDVLSGMLYMPATSFRMYAELFFRELSRRHREWIFFPPPHMQKQLPGSSEHGPLNGALFAVGI